MEEWDEQASDANRATQQARASTHDSYERHPRHPRSVGRSRTRLTWKRTQATPRRRGAGRASQLKPLGSLLQRRTPARAPASQRDWLAQEMVTQTGDPSEPRLLPDYRRQMLSGARLRSPGIAQGSEAGAQHPSDSRSTAGDDRAATLPGAWTWRSVATGHRPTNRRGSAAGLRMDRTRTPLLLEYGWCSRAHSVPEQAGERVGEQVIERPGDRRVESAAQEGRELRGYPPLRAGHPLTAPTVALISAKGSKGGRLRRRRAVFPLKGGGQRG